MAIKINGATVIADNQAFTTTSTISASGNITGGNISVIGTVTAAGINTGSSPISTTGNITGGNISATNLSGSLTTAAQANITSVGTLTSLSVTGTVQGGNVATAGTISATGDINSAGVILGNVVHALSGVIGNPVGVANLFLGNNNPTTVWIGGGASNVNIANVNSTTRMAGNATVGGTISATGAVTGTTLTGTSLTVSTGNVSCGNIVNTNANGVGNIGSTGTRFNQVFALASSAQYADLAEKYTADADYAPGTVLVFGGSAEVTVDAADADSRVAGVVSTNPAYIMNDGLSAEFVTAVALTGRVPCLVTGTVRKGDLMVAAGLGRARSAADPRVGTVIGKALENHDGESGTIEVVVGRF